MAVAVTTYDQESFNAVLSVPWLRESIVPTGRQWGKRIADVKISRFPQNLLGQVLLIDRDKVPTEYILDQVRVVIFRWDRYDYLGWEEKFPLTLTFPDGSIYEFEVPPSAKLEDGHSLCVQINPSITNLRERPQQKNRIVPRIVFNLSAPLNRQLTHSIRRLLKNIRKMTDLVQCTAMYLVIEDEAGLKEVQSSGILNFPEAYAALRSGSYKADLLRYYLLYRYGGVYLDDKTFLRHSIDSPAFDSILVDKEQPCEMFVGYCRSAEISFMGSRRGSPVMLKALETSISNIMTRTYGSHRLSITGNLMFNKMLQDGNEDDVPIFLRRQTNPSELGETRSERWGEKVAVIPITSSDERIMYGDDIMWQRQAIPSADWPKPPTYYANLWNQHLVYVDRNPDLPFLRPPMTAEAKREFIAYSLTIFAILCVGFLISRYPPISWI